MVSESLRLTDWQRFYNGVVPRMYEATISESDSLPHKTVFGLYERQPDKRGECAASGFLLCIPRQGPSAPSLLQTSAQYGQPWLKLFFG
jgi:hypothetical protein